MTDSPNEPPRSAAHPTGARDRRGSRPFLTFVVMLVILAVGVFIAVQFSNAAKIQDCVMSGRRNCAPIDTDPGAH